MNLRRTLEQRICDALAAAGAPGAAALVAPAANPRFGDYQANGVMAAAKGLKTNPRQLAEKVLAAAKLDDLAEKVEIAGPGFINITLKSEFLSAQVSRAAADERLGVPAVGDSERQNVVIDYSSPNLAKEMHVGHLRSTIIGDAIARVLEFQGHRVIRQNHVGDWGTQFGMLIANLPPIADLLDITIPDLEKYYVEAKKRFDAEPEFAETARSIVAEMHRVGPDAWRTSDAIMRWRIFRKATLEHCYQVYGRLGIWFTPAEFRAKWQPHGPGQVVDEVAPAEQTGIVGESFYNADLPQVVADLKAKGILQESQGAKCVFPKEFKDKDGEAQPVLVEKSGGGYLYATTDLAAIRYRVNHLKANRILYVVGAPQAFHLRQVFAVAREAEFSPPEVSLEHILFGSVLGSDNRPFKTREGGTVKLTALLDEAEQRALALVSEKNPDLPEDRRREIARVVGIGAVKYADLSQNRASDYVFSFEKMLSLEGNTAPYMQYAYARVQSIFRKGQAAIGGDKHAPSETTGRSVAPVSSRDREGAGTEILVAEAAERRLAVKLLQFPETIQTVAADGLPNLLCGYLYELAGAFMSFYESCPVLQSAEPVRSSRLALCRLTASVVGKGLQLLGIDVLDQM